MLTYYKFHHSFTFFYFIITFEFVKPNLVEHNFTHEINFIMKSKDLDGIIYLINKYSLNLWSLSQKNFNYICIFENNNIK